MCVPLQLDSRHATQPGAEAFSSNNLPTLILERDGDVLLVRATHINNMVISVYYY